jgi:hypothetical protein
MNKECFAYKHLALLLSALILPACDKSPTSSVETVDEPLQAQIADDKYLCDEMVESKGAKGAYEIMSTPEHV